MSINCQLCTCFRIIDSRVCYNMIVVARTEHQTRRQKNGFMHSRKAGCGSNIKAICEIFGTGQQTYLRLLFQV